VAPHSFAKYTATKRNIPISKQQEARTSGYFGVRVVESRNETKFPPLPAVHAGISDDAILEAFHKDLNRTVDLCESSRVESIV
jgi:hypothetical protein